MLFLLVHPQRGYDRRFLADVGVGWSSLVGQSVGYEALVVIDGVTN